MGKNNLDYHALNALTRLEMLSPVYRNIFITSPNTKASKITGFLSSLSLHILGYETTSIPKVE